MRGDQVPVRLIGAPPDACCWCGTANDAGIYIRSDPKRLRCYGDHRARAG
jgi:hypothetical protein